MIVCCSDTDQGALRMKKLTEFAKKMCFAYNTSPKLSLRISVIASHVTCNILHLLTRDTKHLMLLCENCSDQCAFDCAPLCCTIQHRTVLIIFPGILSIITTQMLSNGGQVGQKVRQ